MSSEKETSRDSRLIALTGATGFIGRRIARRLAADGWRIRALVRHRSRTGDLGKLPVEFVEGALEDDACLQALVRGVSAIVYCAGAVRGIDAGDFAPANVDGVSSLARLAMAQQHPPRFLLVSSLAARHPELSEYARSKREGERVLEAMGSAIDWLALRPPAVYGPGDRELLPLFLWMKRGIAPLLGTPDARFSVLYVDDLAEAVCRWLDLSFGESGIYELDDGRVGGYSWGAVADTVAQLCQRQSWRISIPGGLLYAIAVTSERLARLLGVSPMLTSGKVRELRYPDWVCDNARIRARLQWQPRVGLPEGLRRVLLLSSPAKS